MSWRGPAYDGEFPSLGWGLLEWWRTFLPSPRDSEAPLVFTPDQARVLLEWYRVHPVTGKYVHRRGQSRRSKGIGKSPVEAAKCIAELAGDVVPDGFDANGEPVGRPWGTGNLPAAWVQIGAVSEDQTENTHSVVYHFLTANDGAAAQALHIDPGLTRTYLKDGARTGKLEPVTAAAGSREGQPITYATLDETHLWTPSNHGRKLAATLRRNVAKMGGRTYETTNSFIPGEGTVAEGTTKAHDAGAEGVFVDAVEAPRLDLDDCTDTELRAALQVAYGDAWWVDLDRLVRDSRDPDMPREDVERFFLNWNVKGGGKAVDLKRFAELARAGPDTDDVPDEGAVGRIPDRGAYIALGFDGSISEDCTALRGCTPGGYSFRLGIWKRPPNASADWRVPRLDVLECIHNAFDYFHVGRMFADPAKWYTELEGLAARYNDDDNDIVIVFDTNKETRFAPAVDRWLTAIREGTHTHDNDPDLVAHVGAAHKRKSSARAEDDDPRTLYVLVKGEDRRKIDDAVADVLAHEAALTMPEQVIEPERTFFGAWA